MPTYDYRCGQCDHEWELFQSITAKPVRKCPECSKLKAKRVIGPGAGIIFRGSGFYQTDYRSKSYKDGAAADKKASEKTSESKSPASDTGSKGSTKNSNSTAAD